MADVKKQKLPKNIALPPLQTAEIVASMIWLWLESNEYLRNQEHATKKAHLDNLIEWLQQQHALTDDDVIPF